MKRKNKLLRNKLVSVRVNTELYKYCEMDFQYSNLCDMNGYKGTFADFLELSMISYAKSTGYKLGKWKDFITFRNR